jgi:RNase H-like domain found in reverse transcriptase
MLKNICISYPVLHTPDWSKQFVMETDVSGYALEAVLMQEFEDRFHPIAFNSRSLLPAEQNYDTHDKELTGVIFGFKCSHPFLLGAKYIVHIWTDHKNLQYFCQPQKINGRQARWFEFLQDFDYTLEHIPGSSNTIADLLSQQKDLNKGVDTDESRTLLPNHLFLKRTYLKDNPETR